MKQLLLATLFLILFSSCTKEGNSPTAAGEDTSSGSSRSSNSHNGSSSPSGTEFIGIDGGLKINPALDAQTLFFTAYDDAYLTQMVFRHDTVIFTAEVPQGNYQLSYAADGFNFTDLTNGTATAKTASAKITIKAIFPKDSTDTTFTFRIRSTESTTAPKVDEEYELNIPWETIPSQVTMVQGDIFTQVNETAMDVGADLYISQDSKTWNELKRVASSLSTFFIADSGDHKLLAIYSRRNMECVVCSGSYTSSKLTGMIYYVSPIIDYTTTNRFTLLLEDSEKYFQVAKISIEPRPVFNNDTLLSIYYSRDSLNWEFFGKSSSPWLDFMVPEDSVTFFVKASFDTLGNHYESNTLRMSDHVIGTNCEAQADSIYITWEDKIWDTTFVYLGTTPTDLKAIDTLFPIPDHSPWDYDRTLGAKRIGTGTNYCRTEHKYVSGHVTFKSKIRTIEPLATP